LIGLEAKEPELIVPIVFGPHDDGEEAGVVAR
jgi:hypothetical protein